MSDRSLIDPLSEILGVSKHDITYLYDIFGWKIFLLIFIFNKLTSQDHFWRHL